MNGEALQALEATSRTFFLPIAQLPEGLREAVGSAYLCMRAIDEIEDHTELQGAIKAKLLRAISWIFQAQSSIENFAHDELNMLFQDYLNVLPEVTVQIGEWACQAPKFIAPRIWEATAAMADRMAQWAATGWKIFTSADLDRYTYGVAGAVGLVLCDIWAWFEKVQINRTYAIQFGRGLQAVNILRNRDEDLSRGIDFFPDGWHKEDMHEYAQKNLEGFNQYAESLPNNSFTNFVQIPRVLAFATLDVLARGGKKLTRQKVLEIVREIEEK